MSEEAFYTDSERLFVDVTSMLFQIIIKSGATTGLDVDAELAILQKTYANRRLADAESGVKALRAALASPRGSKGATLPGKK